MRICLLTEKYPPDMGGVAQTVARHARALAQAGHTVHVCVPTAGLLHDGFRTYVQDGVTVHNVGMHRQWRDTLVAWSDRLIEVDHEIGFDVFHGCLIPYAGFVAAYLARLCDRRSVISAYNNDLDRQTFDATGAPFVFKALEWADVLTAVSEDVARTMRAMSGRHDIDVIHNSVDVELFTPNAIDEGLRDRLGLDENLVLGFIGEATAEKGLPMLLRAFARVASQVPVHLVFVGGILARDQPVMDRFLRTYPHFSVRQIPYQSHQVLASYYNLMDLVLLPLQRNGLPNILLEAMACARPVVATSVGGIVDVVTHGQDGWLIPPDDEDALVESILTLSAATDVRERIGSAARAQICAEYASSLELASYLAIYERLLDREP
jgi:glycosyltransferase involved in cell wall biosynthesis